MNLVKRNKKQAYYGVKDTEGSFTFHKMVGFTEFSTSKNPKEYKRQYVDEEFERSAVVGFSPSISYSFDLFEGNFVHSDMISIADNEMVGTDAQRPIILVDFTSKGNSENSFKAIKRNFSIIPDSEGDSVDAYTYSGSLKADGEKIFGEVTSDDDFETITFTED